MKSRAARLTLLILFIVSLGVSASLFWRGESQARSQAASLRSFHEGARTTMRALLDTRAAQQAYVAAGQGGEFWPSKVASGITVVKSGLLGLRKSASSPDAATALDEAVGLLDDFARLDRRVRDYTRTGQNLLASDLVFGDALEMAGAIDARLEQARTAETAVADAAVATFRHRQVFALTAGAAAAALVVLLLLPGAEPAREPALAPVIDRERSSAGAAAAPARRIIAEPDEYQGTDPADLEVEGGWRRADAPAEVKPDDEPAAGPVATVPPSLPEAATTASAALHTGTAAATDLRGLASLCTDLARVVDTQQLPSLLDRASSLLDARGIILWIADPEGRELNPIVAHGYPAQLVNRLGTIERGAENATAAAFRTSLLQTVEGGGANGAIAAPLVTPGGCVGVMAAEVRGDTERDTSKLAAAAILAAQLATLVGPPTRNHNKVEMAGA